MFSLKKWFQKQNNTMRKTAGLEEKRQATSRKMQVAMTILDRRKEQAPIRQERRQELYDYHGKLA